MVLITEVHLMFLAGAHQEAQLTKVQEQELYLQHPPGLVPLIEVLRQARETIVVTGVPILEVPTEVQGVHTAVQEVLEVAVVFQEVQEAPQADLQEEAVPDHLVALAQEEEKDSP